MVYHNTIEYAGFECLIQVGQIYRSVLIAYLVNLTIPTISNLLYQKLVPAISLGTNIVHSLIRWKAFIEVVNFRPMGIEFTTALSCSVLG